MRAGLCSPPHLQGLTPLPSSFSRAGPSPPPGPPGPGALCPAHPLGPGPVPLRHGHRALQSMGPAPCFALQVQAFSSCRPPRPDPAPIILQGQALPLSGMIITALQGMGSTPLLTLQGQAHSSCRPPGQGPAPPLPSSAGPHSPPCPRRPGPTSLLAFHGPALHTSMPSRARPHSLLS